MRVVPFEPAHCEQAKAHPSQAHHQHLLDDPSVFRGQWPETFSAIDGDDLIAIGGTITHPDVTGGWVLFTDKITPARFVAVHRAVERVLAGIDQPVMAHINPSNPQAVRWAGMLEARNHVQ